MAMVLVCSILLVFGNAHAGTTTVDGTGFANTLEMDQTQFHLKGAALLKYLVFIKAYAGAFYLPESYTGPQALDDIPKHLVLEYRVAILAGDFADATREKIRESVSSETFERLLPGIESLNRLYRDVEPGDRYALTYIPGTGTRLTYNTDPLGTISGAAFARAVFSIWIGDNPIDIGFRDRLLGKHQ